MQVEPSKGKYALLQNMDCMRTLDGIKKEIGGACIR